MNQFYYDAVTKMEQLGVDDEYIQGWQCGFLQNPKREEQRLTEPTSRVRRRRREEHRQLRGLGQGLTQFRANKKGGETRLFRVCSANIDRMRTFTRSSTLVGERHLLRATYR